MSAAFTVFQVDARAADRLDYQRRGTRSETRAATIAAALGERIEAPWQLLGPCKLSDQAQIEALLLAAEGPDLAASHPGKNGPIAWRQVAWPDGRVHSLQSLGDSKDSACYLYRALAAPEPRALRVSLGFDDTLALWLNGQLLFSGDQSRTLRAASEDQAFVTLPLRAGTNHLLLRVVNHDGPWAVYFAPTLTQAALTRLERMLDRDFPPAGEPGYYRLESLPLPSGESIEVGGMAFRPDGKLYVGTRRGDVWLVENATADDPEQVSFRLFARGLHEILGLYASGDRELFLAQRPELTRLVDSDGDDAADIFETISDRFGMSGAYHEFHYGPVRDPAGQFFVALNLGLVGNEAEVAYRGCVMRIASDGTTVPFAFGLRSPNGIGMSPDGRLLVTDNQGEWIPACKLVEPRQGDFFGHKKSLPWLNPDALSGEVAVTPPALWLPYGLCRSASEPAWDTTGGKFGPFAGQCFIGENTNSLILRADLEEVGGRLQGACFAFRKGHSSGVNRLAFAPDGSLFVGQTNRGWGSVGGQTHAIQRLLFTGRIPFEMHSMRANEDGWTVSFTTPFNREQAAKLENYFVESYTYHYWERYGSPEIERRRHEISSVEVDPSLLSVVVRVPQRELGRVYRLRIQGLTSADGDALLHREAFYTLNALPPAAPSSAAGM